MKVKVTVNGTVYDRDVQPRELLAYFLREDCGLTGTHVGCDTSSCGCCVVVMDGGRAVKSCTMFAVQADGHEILTVEGLANGATLHPLQQGFLGPARPAMRILHTGHAAHVVCAAQAEPESERSRASAKGCRAICAAAPATRTS